MLLTHLPAIGRRHDDDKPMVWRLHAAEQRELKAAIESQEWREGRRLPCRRSSLASRETLQGPLFGTDST
jgi:hypothetical protein